MTLQPIRPTLTPDETEAARLISPHVFGRPYQPGRGPLHWSRSRHDIRLLLHRAQQWERLASAARVCAATISRSVS